MATTTDPSQILKAFLFPHIFRAFRMAIHPRKMAIAFSAVVLVSFAGRVMDLSKTVYVDDQGQTELDRYVLAPTQLDTFLQQEGQHHEKTGVFVTLFEFSVTSFKTILRSLKEFDVTTVFVILENLGQLYRAVEWAFMYHLLYSLGFFAIALAVISVAGGAICRMAALEFAQNERPGLIESLRFGIARFRSLFAAPLTPLVIVALIGSFILVLGLIGNIKYAGELLIGLSMPLVMIAGMMMMFVVLGTIGGLSLMFPTIAFENSECFMAVNNSFRYVFARPWRLGCYMGVAIVYGAISFAMVRFFVFGLLTTCYRFFQLGFLNANVKLERLWIEPRFESFFTEVTSDGLIWSELACAFMIKTAVLSVVGLIIAFVVSYCFSVNTIIYALIRHRVDSTGLHHVASVYADDNDEDNFLMADG
jgi:hypothetical protein